MNSVLSDNVSLSARIFMDKTHNIRFFNDFFGNFY